MLGYECHASARAANGGVLVKAMYGCVESAHRVPAQTQDNSEGPGAMILRVVDNHCPHEDGYTPVDASKTMWYTENIL